MKSNCLLRTLHCSRALVVSTQLVVLSLFIGQAQAGNTWTGGGGSTNWNDNNNWGGAAPTYGTLIFTTGGAQGTTSVNNSITAQNRLLWTGSSSWTLNNSGGTVLSLFDNGGTQAKVENQSTGLVTINAPITFAANNGAPPNPFGEINAVNGDITFGSGTLTVNGSSVNGVKLFGSNRTTTFNNTVSSSGKWVGLTGATTTMAVGGAFTSGDIYVMNGGTLKLNSGGTVTTSALRLGGDFGNTGNQNQALGGTLQLTSLTGGQSFSSVINTVTGNTSNALLIDSLNTSGTNTLAGASFLDSDLKTQVASGGTLSFTGGSIDVKIRKLTVAGAGTTIINEPLTSSFSAGGLVVKEGAGTLILQGTSNTYTGTNNVTLNANGTAINAGTLGIHGDGSLGLAPAGAYNNIQFTGSATLQDTANNVSLNANRNISVASAATGTFDNNGNTFTINGIVNGTGGNVESKGAGTTIFTGANTYTGTTTVTQGTLQIGNSSTTGSLGTGAVTNNATLAFNRSNTLTVANDIGGTGTLTQSGAGTTILTGTNSYDTTTISAGTLQIGNGGSTGTIGTGSITNNAALVFNRSGNFVLSNAIGGSGTLAQSGSNIITMSTTNSYTGATTVNSGTLRVTANEALGTGAAGTTVNSGGALRLSGVTYTTAEALTINGSGVGGTGALYNIGGSSTYAGQITVASPDATIGIAGGTLTLTGGVVKNGTTLTVKGTGSVIINGTGISGAAANSDLIVDTTTLVVNAASNYNGPTTVQSAGTLVANAAITSTKVTVNSGSTLSGTSRITTAGVSDYVYLNGSLIVGDSTLGLPVASQIDFKSSGVAGSTVLGTVSTSFLNFDLFTNAGDNTANAASADRIKLFGALANSLSSTLVIGNPNLMLGSSFAWGDKWTLFDLTASASLPSISNNFALDYSNLGTLNSGLIGSFDKSTGVFSIVPEPSRALFLMLGLLGITTRRRRK